MGGMVKVDDMPRTGTFHKRNKQPKGTFEVSSKTWSAQSSVCDAHGIHPLNDADLVSGLARRVTPSRYTCVGVESFLSMLSSPTGDKVRGSSVPAERGLPRPAPLMLTRRQR